MTGAHEQFFADIRGLLGDVEQQMHDPFRDRLLMVLEHVGVIAERVGDKRHCFDLQRFQIVVRNFIGNVRGHSEQKAALGFGGLSCLSLLLWISTETLMIIIKDNKESNYSPSRQLG